MPDELLETAQRTILALGLANSGLPAAPAHRVQSQDPLPLPDASHPDSKSPVRVHRLGASYKVTDTVAPVGEKTVSFHLHNF